MRYVLISSCILTYLLLVSCSSDLEKIERTHNVQFYSDVSNIIIPDTTDQKQIFRFKPKVSSDKYAVSFSVSSDHEDVSHSFFRDIEILVTDYEGNIVPREKKMFIVLRKSITPNGTDIGFLIGNYKLSSDNHYRVEFMIPSFHYSEKQASLTVQIGVLEID